MDLVCDFVCGLLNHMARIGAARVDVALGPDASDMPRLPWTDPEVFNPGYLMRGMHLLPKRGDRAEWAHSQDYWWEKDVLPKVSFDDDAFRYADARGRPISRREAVEA